MKNYKHYTDFLKDEQFIRWQILPDDDLKAHWKEFTTQNPHLSGELERAIGYLKTTGLNNTLLSPQEQELLINRIRQTLAKEVPPSRIRTLMRYTAAACMIAIVAISGIIWYLTSENSETDMSDSIVGSLRNGESIQLITGNETTSFSEDITLSVNEAGETKVRREGQTAEESLKTRKNATSTLIVPYGKRSQITLSDGTKVWVNSGSELRFSTTFSEKTRDIFINGEIYIEVAENTEKPFYVHTPAFSVNVFGTKFNVSSYQNETAEVVLVEGSIALETTRSKNRVGTKLVPGEMATFNEKGTFEKKPVDVRKYTCWKDGYIILSGTPMSEALLQIGRLYNLSLDFGENVNLQNKRCTGKLLLSENLDDVLNTIASLSGTTYQRNNEKVIIKNNEKK